MTINLGYALRAEMDAYYASRDEWLNRPPETPDEVRAQEIGVLRLFRDSTYRKDDESLDSMLKRKWPYMRNPKYHHKQGYQHRVVCKPLAKYAKWMNKNCSGAYSYEEYGISFVNSNDALMFKLSCVGL